MSVISSATKKLTKYSAVITKIFTPNFIFLRTFVYVTKWRSKHLAQWHSTARTALQSLQHKHHSISNVNRNTMPALYNK